MKQKITILFLLTATFLSAQISYKGFIDKYPIELVSNIYSDGVGIGAYAYSNFDTPIRLEAKLTGKTLVLIEKDKDDKSIAKFTFQNYNAKNNQLNGIWKDNSGKELKVTLSKLFDIDDKKEGSWKGREILQSVSSKNNYFKVILSKDKNDFEAKVTGVKMIEKRTDKLIQQFDVDCQLLGTNNIDIDDFNFDGFPDFSVYEGGTAGPDSTSLYFLYNPKTGKYFESSFAGSSLEFDSNTKRIYEHSQCCGGSKQTDAEYKVVNNKMVLIKKTCLEYDQKTGGLKKVKCN